MRRLALVLSSLSGCYIDGGLGYAHGAGEAHGSVGFAVHFDSEHRTTGHVALGGAIGAFPLTLELDAWEIGEMLDCLLSKQGCNH